MKNKYVAAVLAFIFGFLGIHRFYLKQYFLGFLYLVFSPLGAIAGLIDGILFLTADQMEFDNKYNKEYFSHVYGITPYEFVQNKKIEARERYIELKNAEKFEHKYADMPKRNLLEKGKKHLSEYDLHQAINTFSKILEQQPEHKEAHYYIACTYSLLEQVHESLYHLELAIEYGLEPSRIEEENALAFVRISNEYQNFKKNEFKKTKASAKTDTLLEQLEKLASLRERGILTPEEFHEQKAKIMKPPKTD